MLAIPKPLLDGIVASARSEAPEEVCGWLAGKGDRVLRVYPVPNVAWDPKTAFRMEPEVQLRAMREIREAGLDLTGTYHSHPRTPAEPSPRDLQLGFYPDYLHLNSLSSRRGAGGSGFPDSPAAPRTRKRNRRRRDVAKAAGQDLPVEGYTRS